MAIRSAAYEIREGIRAVGTRVDAASLMQEMAPASAGNPDLDEFHSIAISCDSAEIRQLFEVEALRVEIVVSKIFTDSNPGEVEVFLNCTSGLIFDQSKVISAAEPVTFVLTEFTSGAMNCEVTEEDSTGYSTSYFDGTESSSAGCTFAGVVTGADLSCVITNTPLPVTVTVNKRWVYESTAEGEVDDSFALRLQCNAPIAGGNEVDGIWTLQTTGLSGDASIDYAVTPSYLGSTCSATEQGVVAAVEVDDSECDSINVTLANNAECTIVNTVFYEGIPALNRSSLLLLVLMLSGLGVVGMSRM